MRRLSGCLFCCLLLGAAQAPKPRSVDEVLQAYIQAVGGMPAIDKINTREVRGRGLTYYWQRPNKVLQIHKKEKTGYDGSSGWTSSRKKKVKHLARGAELPLEMDANPLRYVRLKDLYSEVNPAPRETLDSKPMDVLVAPNNLGATKLYFDAASHLLSNVEETGETSAYFTTSTEFTDYRPVDGVQFPFRIKHSTTEPGGESEDFRVTKVIDNVDLKPQVFSKPLGGTVIFGGKR
ncbi:MAG TPA: hypothetical protein VGL97_11345 [Bryobacteraceae bacterium]|jgi:hypothetical protein